MAELVGRKKSKAPIFIIIGVVVLLAVVGVVIFLVISKSGSSYDKKIRAAEKYLDELDYEQAIAYYQAAIDINPDSLEAYIGLADVYLAMADYKPKKAEKYFNKALHIIDDAIENITDEDELEEAEKYKEKIEKLIEENDDTSDESEQVIDDSVSEVTGAEAVDGEEDEDDGLEGKYVISKVIYPKWNFDSSDWTEEYEYDEYGRLLKKEVVYSGWEPEIYNYTYDEYGRLLKEEVIYSGSEPRIYNYTYDENGCKTITYIGEIYHSISQYDEHDNIIKHTLKGTSNDGIYNYVNEYDDNGNLVKVTTKLRSTYRTEYYYYDSEGRLISEEIEDTYDIHYFQSITYEYDQNGNCIKRYELHKSEDPSYWPDIVYYESEFITIYTYDEHYNLISEVEYLNDDYHDNEVRYSKEYEYIKIKIDDITN